MIYSAGQRAMVALAACSILVAGMCAGCLRHPACALPSPKAPVGRGKESDDGRTTAMGNLHLFHKTTWQLIRTPAGSASTLDATALGRPFQNPSGARMALMEAKGWLVEPLRGPYQAPPGTPMAAITKEEGRCDVIRSRHRAGDVTVETAQTRYLLSIRFHGLPLSGTTPEKRAEVAAHEVLSMSETARFETLGVHGACTFGRHASQRKRIDPDWPQWLDSLGWWTDDQDVGFVFIKSFGGPTCEVISGGEDMNAEWWFLVRQVTTQTNP